MTFDDKLKALDEEGLFFTDKLSAQCILIVQNLLLTRRDNEPLEDWSYEKIVSLSDRQGVTKGKYEVDL